jgi:hypothetical protein
LEGRAPRVTEKPAPAGGSRDRAWFEPRRLRKFRSVIGNKLVAITATATPASLAQVEALVNQLL